MHTNYETVDNPPLSIAAKLPVFCYSCGAKLKWISTGKPFSYFDTDTGKKQSACGYKLSCPNIKWWTSFVDSNHTHPVNLDDRMMGYRPFIKTMTIEERGREALLEVGSPLAELIKPATIKPIEQHYHSTIVRHEFPEIDCAWLACELVPGQFSSEYVATIKAYDNKEFSLFVDKRDTGQLGTVILDVGSTEQAITGKLKVRKLKKASDLPELHNSDKILVELPAQTVPQGQNTIWVRSNQLTEWEF